MYLLIFLPFGLQTILIGADEYFFHIKRGLPKWERIGHPLDTLTVLSCFLFILLIPYTEEKISLYACLALFSCIFVTKDEFIHKHHCPASEQWLHALLFINHPILLTLAGCLWPLIHQKNSFAWLDAMLAHSDMIRIFIMAQCAFITSFFLYQTIYWNILWKNPKKS